MFENIKVKVKDLEPLLIDIRRYLHQNPELSGQEFNTSNYIHNKLQEAGIESEIIQTEAGPAVVADILVDENKDTIAFRADMDGLPLCDKKNKPYTSKKEGVMHACGHDFNVTTVLGTALLLASLRQSLNTNIRFIFQPKEESSQGGAYAVIKKGVMEGVKSIFAVHALPTLQAGKVGIRYGTVTAGIDSFKIKVNGVSGHSARPHKAVDAIFVATQILSCLYSDVPRNFNPVTPVVLSVGKIQGGSAPNIISDYCEFEGTVRTLDRDIRDKLSDLIREKAENIAKTYGATAEVEWTYGPPPVINDSDLAKLSENSAIMLLGAENVVRIEKPSMGAEDFSRYLEYAPGILVRIGTGGENTSYPLHSCLFDIDESALAVSVGLLSLIAVNYKQYDASFYQTGNTSS